MELRCPKCESAINIGVVPPKEIHCGECGSTFVRPVETISFVPASGEQEITYVLGEHQKTPNSPPKLRDYEILEVIAQGGMGVVYKARQRSLNRTVALKVIRSGELANAEQVARFHVEAEAAAHLDHHGIVPVYEVGNVDGRHFYSMAFVDGETLHEKVKNSGPLPPKRAAEIMKTVAEAVQYGHEKSITNRDIKPHNILLDKSESPRITDFGLARHGDSEMTVAGQVMGTPSYMPPEQAEGKHDEVGPLSDVYSLGATLYYVLTGRPPFHAASTTETLWQVVNAIPAAPHQVNPNIPRDLETVCLKCLRKDRTGRYGSAQEFGDDLARWLENKPIVGRRVTAIEKTWLWCKRRPAIAGSIVAILISALIFVGLAAAERRRNLKESVRTTVASLSTTRGIILPPLKDLDSFPREMVLSALRERFESTNDARLPLAYALARYGDVRVAFLVSKVATASHDDVDNLVAALSQSKPESIAALEQAARAAELKKNWRHKARLALLACHLEASSVAQEMCRLQPYPQRTWFIKECSTWHGDLSNLGQLTADSDDGPLRSAIILAVGNAPDVSNGAKQKWATKLASWHQSQPDTLTHSASGWTLRKWNLSPPELLLSRSPSDGMNWHVNRLGMTMLKIPPGSFVRRDGRAGDDAIQQTVTLTRSFLLGDREVTRGQFQQFVDDPDSAIKRPDVWPEATNSTEQYPATQVSWYDAVLFCNWLSRKEGLTPCYERTGSKDPAIYERTGEGNRRKKREYDAWRLVVDARGYRLPTEAEWEYACRAETTTIFSHGDDESLLDQYAVYRASGTEVTGSKLPNGRGLFDVHGNVWELCSDRYLRPFGFGAEENVTDPIGTEHGLMRPWRGGSFNFLAKDAASGYRLTQNPTYRGVHLGFRVARTHPSK